MLRLAVLLWKWWWCEVVVLVATGVVWCVGDFVASMRLRMAVPSKGAPISSSEVLVLRGRC